jgi:hypothetical protein
MREQACECLRGSRRATNALDPLTAPAAPTASVGNQPVPLHEDVDDDFAQLFVRMLLLIPHRHGPSPLLLQTVPARMYLRPSPRGGRRGRPAGSHPHLASVLLQGRKSANIHASLGVNRGIPVKGRKPSCGKRSDIVGRRRRSARHALKKLPTKTRASFLSGFGIPGLARRTDTTPPARPGQAIARRQLGRPPAFWQSVLRRLRWCEGNT